MPINNINSEDLKKIIDSGEAEIIDIREPDEYNIIRFKGAKLIPMSALEYRLEEIDWTKKVIFYCRTGARSRMICGVISAKGKEVNDLNGGIYACWQKGMNDILEIPVPELLSSYF